MNSKYIWRSVYLVLLLISVAITVTGFKMLKKERPSSLPKDSFAKSNTSTPKEEIVSLRKFKDIIADNIFLSLTENGGKGTEPFVLPETQGPVYLVLRSSGSSQFSTWVQTDNWHQGINDAIDKGIKELSWLKLKSIDALEICLTHSYRNIDLRREFKEISNTYRGIRGVRFSYKNVQKVWGPTEMIAKNVSFSNARKSFREENNITVSQMRSEIVETQIFETYQFIVSLRNQPKVIPILRGNTLVPIESVTKENVMKLANDMGNWLVTHVRENGRMTYKYWPSRGQETAVNNMIRQAMASVCLVRMFARPEDKALLGTIDRNITYFLEKFYHKEGDLGLIEYNEKVKLGAVALTTLAIVESPLREKFAAYEKPMLNLIDHLWNDDGSFTTFYKPAGRNDNQNFYSGEALLLWARLYSQTEDPQLHDKILKSFEYYKNWHLTPKNRNPAFVPWHTQAYYIVWQKTHLDELKDFIFEMNDWLLDMQQWEGTRFDDEKGRFYNPKKLYGPPHASSTGVYLEGLIDAFCLAREIGDKQRQENYRIAIIRGLRSVMQLQFADEVDMFYISRRNIVKGSIRTTVYDNEIRVDNIQHNLMGIMKILKNFHQKDWDIGSSEKTLAG